MGLQEGCGAEERYIRPRYFILIYEKDALPCPYEILPPR